ncbi:MAG: DNA-deoxyinosine glycosylase [Lachnospiraceae bacterium]|nr:DNA-deoxyinosine glycosylase [Lachnospiraceae bacterium]
MENRRRAQLNKGKYKHVTHEFGPVYDERSKILILGSLPSVKSREQQFYYGHPQNRFWRVLAAVAGAGGSVPDSVDEKRAFLLESRVALWDVIAACDIIGSADSTIKNVQGNDMSVILNTADIRAIFTNGAKAHTLFWRYCMESCPPGLPVVRLPSTSPANAAWSEERLIGAWQEEIGKYLQQL